jgi:hypothetical protein
MNKLIVISALSLFAAFSGFAQTKDVKGPKYKNTKPSERNEGSSSILVKEDPNQLKGPRLKNFNPAHYEIEIKDSIIIEEKQNTDLVVSTENKDYSTEEGKEKIIYRRVETKDMKGKHTKGLKGPSHKNYKQ